VFAIDRRGTSISLSHARRNYRRHLHVPVCPPRRGFGAEPSALVRNMLLSTVPMDTERLSYRSTSLADAERWLALGTGALLLLTGASRRSTVGAWLAASSAPLLYRGVTGRWPDLFHGYVQPDSTKTALGPARSIPPTSSHTGLVSKMRRRCIARSETNTTLASRSS
jgi:hypothetical protein